MHKVYKNGICPCGSGEKYKNCCFKQQCIEEQWQTYSAPLAQLIKILED